MTKGLERSGSDGKGGQKVEIKHSFHGNKWKLIEGWEKRENKVVVAGKWWKYDAFEMHEKNINASPTATHFAKANNIQPRVLIQLL